ncbi:MAG: flagellar filament outer layer protein FlaA [Spirochaetaceae bacterium]|jgi:hypothetical protein|nr:flagellar filament outer layer protein FlaA [Spirochaetaceae bacterium]
MKRSVIIVLIVSMAAAGVFAQGTNMNADQLGVLDDWARYKEVSVDKFEYEGAWKVTMSSDEGYATARLFKGGPAGKEPIEDEKDLGIADDYVLGVRIDFLRRGTNSFYIYSRRPIPVEGIVQGVSVWVAGRNFRHTLHLLLEDAFGRNFEIRMGTLNFPGWKKLTVRIPQSRDGVNGIVQQNYHYPTMMGIKIVGFRIDCDPVEAYGSYYVYFDDLRAYTDLSDEENRAKDDPIDMW